MCLLDLQIVLYSVGSVAIVITGIKLYKDIIRYNKTKRDAETELEKKNFSLEGN